MASTFKFIISLIVLFCMVLGNAQSQPDIHAIPDKILPGLTSSLEVNCNFSLEETSSMVALISLIVARAKDSGHDFEELASITTHSNNEVAKLTPENISASGSFTAFGKSHLHLRWNFPSDLQAGFYKCQGHGLDPIGRVVTMADTAEVTVKQPSFDVYDDKFQDFDKQMKALMQTISDMDSRTKSQEEIVFELKQNASIMESKLSSCDQDVKGLERTVSALLHVVGFEDPLVYNGHSYHVSADPFTSIEKAEANCTRLGGYVVEIDDIAEYTAIKNFLKNAVGYHYVVIAGSDEDTEGTWIFPSTKQPVPVLDWRSDQPNGGSRENCLDLCTPSSSWQMCDLPCVIGPDPSIRYMCEVP